VPRLGSTPIAVTGLPLMLLVQLGRDEAAGADVCSATGAVAPRACWTCADRVTRKQLAELRPTGRSDARRSRTGSECRNFVRRESVELGHQHFCFEPIACRGSASTCWPGLAREAGKSAVRGSPALNAAGRLGPTEGTLLRPLRRAGRRRCVPGNASVSLARCPSPGCRLLLSATAQAVAASSPPRRCCRWCGACRRVLIRAC